MTTFDRDRAWRRAQRERRKAGRVPERAREKRNVLADIAAQVQE